MRLRPTSRHCAEAPDLGSAEGPAVATARRNATVGPFRGGPYVVRMPEAPREFAESTTPPDRDRRTRDLLADASTRGDPHLHDDLVALLYDELRAIAHRQLGRERSGHTLTTTALVHEAYLKLSQSTQEFGADRARFFAAAANTMRRVLVDYARSRNARKREGMRKAVELHDAIELVADESEQLVALDEALEQLQATSPRLVRVVECRFFIGLSEAETAGVLGTSVRTVRREWVNAKGWLAAALR